MKQYLATLVLWLWACCGMMAASAEPRLAAEEAFKLTGTEVLNAQQVRLTWQIADGYFLLRSKFRFDSATPGLSAGEPKYPASETLEDSFFGKQEVYRRSLTLDIPIQAQTPASPRLLLNAGWQGCHGMEDCYATQQQQISVDLPIQVSVALQADPQNASSPPAANPPLAKQDEKDIPMTPGASEEFLDPEVAFVFSADLERPDLLVARWLIADGYYLYRDKFKLSLQNAPAALGKPVYPASDSKQDPTFGKVDVYHKMVRIEIPITPPPGLNHLIFDVQYQGCAEAGLCYPPIQKSITLDTVKKAVAQLGKPKNGGLLGAQEDFLDPEQAFIFSASLESPEMMVAAWQITDGYYLYRDKLKFKLNGGELGEIQLPASKSKDDPEFGKVEVYYHQIQVRLPVKSVSGPLLLEVGYQGCAEAGLCYPPIKKFASFPPKLDAGALAEISSSLEPAKPTFAVARAAPAEVEPQSEQDMIADVLKKQGTIGILLSFFGFGLLLAFTPCVFPMIPILSSIIVGQKNMTTYKAFILSLVYVLAMALTYTVAGVFAGMVGENLQAAFQNPWVLGSFALVFVVLSFSMFGFYDLQMPGSIQSKLTDVSNRQQGGTWIGVAIMGFLSALIVGPCVAAPLVGALIYIGQTGDAVLGGAALFALSMGMGAPLIVIGTSAGKFMPRAGGWMDIVKYVFGVMMLAVAVWMLERILPAQVAMLLWAALFIVPAVYLGATDSLPATASGWRKFWKGCGILMLLYGVLLVIGAAAGGSDILQPLRGLAASGGVATTPAHHGLQFKKIKGLAGLENELALAKSQQKTVMLDFYADWCISCKEMEKFTFSNPGVQAALANTVLLQADVTANDEDDKALLKHFGIFGPPSILFFSRDGEERRSTRVVGFMPADKFLPHVEKSLQ